MHPNQAFRKASRDRNRAFARDRGFGVLTLAGPDGPLASHLPFVLEGDRVEAHIVRSNPIGRILADGPATALLAVSGPDGYVSPDWYGVDEQVPTWNYVAVHLRGVLRLAPPGSLRAHLARLSEAFETRLAPKPAWTLDKLSGATLERMERMIMPVEMRIERTDGTWKLGQNKPAEAAAGAADGVGEAGIGLEPAALVRLMRAALEE